MCPVPCARRSGGLRPDPRPSGTRTGTPWRKVGCLRSPLILFFFCTCGGRMGGKGKIIKTFKSLLNFFLFFHCVCLAAKRQDGGGLFKSPGYPGYPFIMIPDLSSPYLPNGSLSPTARTVSASFMAAAAAACTHCGYNVALCWQQHTHPLVIRLQLLLVMSYLKDHYTPKTETNCAIGVM